MNHDIAPETTAREADQLYAPNGKRIVASKDWLPGNAVIASVARDGSGHFDITWEGTTEVCWNGQFTETEGGKSLYVDDDGEEWREDELALGNEPLRKRRERGPAEGPLADHNRDRSARPHDLSANCYLKLFHGRKTPNEEMNDWGFDGPIIGPVGIGFTYGTLKLHAPDGSDFEEMRYHQDMMVYAGAYYGDAVLFLAGDPALVNLRMEHSTFHDFATFRSTIHSASEIMKEAS